MPCSESFALFAPLRETEVIGPLHSAQKISRKGAKDAKKNRAEVAKLLSEFEPRVRLSGK